MIIISPAIVNEEIAALKVVDSEVAGHFVGEEILDWIYYVLKPIGNKLIRYAVGKIA